MRASFYLHVSKFCFEQSAQDPKPRKCNDGHSAGKAEHKKLQQQIELLVKTVKSLSKEV